MSDVDALIRGLGGTVSPEVAGILEPPGEIPPFPATPPPFGGNGATILDQPLSRKAEQAIVKEAAAPAAARGAPMPSASKRFGALAKLVPGGNRVRIKKRLDNGQLSTIGDYVITDIEQDGDVETFITRRLKPIYNGGDYSIYIIDDKSDDHFAGVVNLMVEPKAPGFGQESQLYGLLAQQQHDLKQALARPQVDPMEQIERTKMIMDKLGGESGGGKNDVLIAMMQMQSNAQAAAAQSQREMMTMLLGQKSAGTDPAFTQLAALMERMDRRLEKLETAPPPMPLGPSGPPPASTVEIITAIAGVASTVVLPLLASMKSDAMKPTELMAIVTNAQASAAQAAASDKVTTRELLEIMRSDKERDRPAATFEDEINRALKMREFALSFAPQQSSGPQGTSFWDALVALFSSNDFAAAIGGRIRDTGPKQIGSGAPQQNGQAQVVDLSRERAKRDAAKEQQPVIQMPAGFDELCKAIDTAEDDGQRVEHTVRALLSLYAIDQWKPFVATLLEATAKNDRETALRGMGGMFKMIVEKGGVLSRESAIATLKAFDENWDLIRTDLVAKAEVVGMPHLKKLAQEAPVPAPQAPQAPQAEQPAQAPQVEQPVQAPQAEQPAPAAEPSDIPADMEGELYRQDYAPG